MKLVSYVTMIALLLVLQGCIGMMAQVKPSNKAFYKEYGEKDFSYSKKQCFSSVVEALNDSGHGVEKQDPAAGKIVSGKSTIYTSASASDDGAGEYSAEVRDYDTRYYVTVSGDEESCTVTINSMRIWVNGREQESETKSWTGYQLQTLLKNTEQSLKFSEF